MRAILIEAYLLLSLHAAATAVGADDSSRVAQTLNDFHQAAAQAEGERYFAHFAPGAIFLGTDASERWTLAEFKAFAQPYFEQGKGWTYLVKSRHIYFSEDQNTAWFDEMLENESYGICRGSGVLIKREGVWKIAQYNLSIPIPNALAKQVVGMIKNENK